MVRKMFKECKAILQVDIPVLEGLESDKIEHSCRIMQWNSEKESFYLQLEEGDLSEVSLDVSYICRIEEKGLVFCKGVVQERYESKYGKILVFLVKKGFYKNLIN